MEQDVMQEAVFSGNSSKQDLSDNHSQASGVSEAIRESIVNEVLNCEANIVCSSDIPVINAQPLLDYARDGQPTEAWRAAVSALDYALNEVGFFTLKNHGLDASEARSVSQQFFQQPLPKKMERAQRPDFQFGYTCAGSEKLFLSEDCYDERNQLQKEGDPKESLNIPPLHLPWHWPASSPGFDGDLFHGVMTRYFRACETFVAAFLPSLAYVLGEDGEFFSSRMREHMSVVRTLNYPASEEYQDNDALGMRASSHTDFGLLTVLQTFGIPGLQVQNQTGHWVDVALSDPSHLVVNIGDALSRMTNGRFKSTRHRVAKLTSAQRQSIAYFVNFNEHALVAPVRKYQKAEGNYPPVSSGDYIFYKNGLAMGYESR